ncbi:MAG: alpha-mannosidase [Pseudothermotoga sp.]|nr:alpha-mannosidase [Pseudothermotoga sp.]MDK2922727.1 alpha-mannosidase [Pseudothermotoga sp.]HBT39271.1 alpha-mannosidase [Pseudothermotoga sp.]HCO97623.1 alpha-mannosidase [Pseudothermotoga sp.]
MNLVICHTHWDREWFAPSSVTNEWLKELFERLFDLVSRKRDYRYVLDGQTLILEDLSNVAPEFVEKLKSLVRSGNLLIGPLYAQIDFRLSPEVAIIKNFELGKEDLKKFGGDANVAWMVDNFGFISQLPQLLKRYGIESVFLWRGVKLEKPSIEFVWESKDGSFVNCIFLIGGYRNLYGLSRTRDLAKKRLKHEIEKLKIFSLSGLVPLLDGYDLDVNPEDPRDLLGEEIQMSTPQEYSYRAFSKVTHLPRISGELLSGKYACVFPGTLSTRVYLKRQAYVVGKLLRYVELLGSFRNERIDELYRTYLKTMLHDNICGVGVDTIHRNMQSVYKKLFWSLRKSFKEELKRLATHLKSGLYAISFSPFEYDHYYCDGQRCYRLQNEGAGFFRVNDFDKTCSNKTLSFRNDHYEAFFNQDGSLNVNRTVTGILQLERELGDCYSTDTEKMDFSCHISKMQVERAGEKHKIVRLERLIKAEGILIETKERIIFDESPLIKWNMTVHCRGRNYLLSFVTESFNRDSRVFAKMPFDVAERDRIDADLLPTNGEEKLNRVLLAAREVGSIRKFPFHGFVALQGEKTLAVMAKGVHQYEVDEEGDMKIDLIRSVEWIAKNDVKGRTGDAGPLMYVPDARCEGTIDFELAISELNADVRSEEFFKWFNLFDDPPVLVSVKKKDDRGSKSLKLFSGPLPWVCVEDGELLVYNPYPKSVHGLRPYRIDTIPMNVSFSTEKSDQADVEILSPLRFPQFVFRRTTEFELEQLQDRIKKIQEEVEKLEKLLKGLKKNSHEYHLSKHELLSKKRTLLELTVSLALNRGKVSKRLMRKLNELRAEKRIYDYIVELLKEGSR